MTTSTTDPRPDPRIAALAAALDTAEDAMLGQGFTVGSYSSERFAAALLSAIDASTEITLFVGGWHQASFDAGRRYQRTHAPSLLAQPESRE